MTNQHLEHLKAIRLAEIQYVIIAESKLISPGCNVLEVGAGAGWQASVLRTHGCTVTAIDTSSSNYEAAANCEVIRYNGFDIPSSNSAFDVIYSSNVIEHVANLAPLAREFTRVLKPSGRMVHLVPSASWRFWTLMTHPLYLIKKLLNRPQNTSQKASPIEAPSGSKQSRVNIVGKANLLLPHRHGEHSNLLGEFYLFSRWGWRRTFQRQGWTIDAHRSCPIFYTGNNLFGEHISINQRRALAKLFGTSCHLFVVHQGSRSW